MARYRIIPERSQVWIDASSSLHPIHSSTDGLEGFIDLEFGSDGGVDLAVAPAAVLSLPVTRLSSGNRLEDRELQKRIDARRFPRIEGVLEEMTSSVDGHGYEVSGGVTFRGVTQHCRDRVDIAVGADGTLQVTGASQFDVRDFGMEPPRILMLRVEPEVAVRIEITAAREATGHA